VSRVPGPERSLRCRRSVGRLISISMPMRFLFIGAAFCLRLLQTPPPCVRLALPLTGCAGDFKPQGLDSTLAVTRGGRTVTLQQESEHKPVRDKEQRYHHGRNEVSRTQLTWLDSNTDKTLIECVEQIRTTPKVEHPDQDDSQPPLEPRQREQGKDCGNEITVCSWASEGARQVRRDNAGHQEWPNR
jgi:hypothetical protein